MPLNRLKNRRCGGSIHSRTARYDEAGEDFMDPLIMRLTRLRGVGEILASRLVEAGLDSFGKIAAAGEDELKKIRGINPRALSSILAQANELSADAPVKTVRTVHEQAALLADRVQVLVETARDRFGQELQGKTGKKIEKDLLRIASILDQSSTKFRNKKKRVVKRLVKAQKRLATADRAGLRELRKRLKKTRKSLAKISLPR